MRIKVVCPYCLDAKDAHVGESITITYNDIVQEDLGDQYYYDLVCPNGHRNRFFIQTPRYELLYDMGVSAYLDGYYREAALDFAAAIERFHEYCILSFLLYRDIPGERIMDMWKQISKQSERQYGAFISLFLSELKGIPDLINNKWTEFRNNVTHKGYFPSAKEIEDYAKYTADYICSVFNCMKTSMDNDRLWQGEIFFAIQELQEKKAEAGGHNICTALSSMKNGKSFDDAISDFKKFFSLFYEK